MKKFVGYFLSLLVMTLSLNFNLTSAHAETKNQFILKSYDCNQLSEELECLGPNGNVEEELNEFLSNADVEPGKIIQLDVYYIPGDVTDVGIQIGVKYDKTLVEPIYDGDTLYHIEDMSTTYQGGIWPAAGTSKANQKRTEWTVQVNDDTESGMIIFLLGDGQTKDELVTEGVISSIYFKVKEDASPGDVINFAYDETFTNLAKKPPLLFSGFTFNVYGQMSNNKALDILSVSNGSTVYPLTPGFTPGSTTDKEFSTTVPNQITNIDIAATASDSTSVVSSGTGNQSLNVGQNQFNVIVTAQNGETEIYKINVYRLSDDATLKTLSLSNNVNIGTFSPGTETYTALVPYSTSSTTIGATKNHANATIKSGTGTWNLTNHGATLNTREIVVQAENCLPEYSSVSGNTCTEKKYKIDVTRTAPSTNADLSSLTINGNSVPYFAANTTTYNLDAVSNSTDSLTVNATVADPGKATITTALGRKNLTVGDNQITVTVQAEDGTTTKTYTINVRRLSNDSSLSNLNVTSTPAGRLSPTFSSTLLDYYTYTAPATVNEVTISATVHDTGKAQVISGTGTFNIDDNPSIDVTVQAEDGTQSIYVVKLVRDKSSNNYLKSLSVTGYNLNKTFNKNDTLYEVNVNGDVSSVTVQAEVEDTGKAQIISGVGTHNLNIGRNTIQIRVQAENGSTKDYTITITRAKKTVALLSDLTVDGTSVPEFNESIKHYELDNVPFSKTSVEIGATRKDEDSTITGIGTRSLSTGDNILYVTVTAQDGVTQTTYSLKIFRERDSNADLSDLTIDGTTITGFDKDDIDYTLTVPNSTKSLNLVATPESNSANVVITGNSNFVTTATNTVTITVTAEDGTIKIYTIDVTREKSENNYLKGISLSDGLLDPVFVKTTQEYTVNVDRSVTSIVITPEVEDSTARATVSGPSSLIIGDNIFEITVVNEKGINDRVYEITVTRNPSNNNYLSNLTVDGTKVSDFSKTKELYTVSVPSTKSSITIGAQAEESHATTIIRKQGDAGATDSTSKTFDLTTGVNTFEVIVTAENEQTRTYSVVVTREVSSDSSLSDLSIVQTSISPTFSPGTKRYTASVAYEVTSIDIVATANTSSSTVTGDGNKTLNTGENSFDVVVTAENNTTTTYTIVVTRAKNNNAHLSNIVISGGFRLTPSFDREEDEYTLTVPNTTDSLTITAYKEDPTAKSITGDGLVQLNTGVNNINIVVTAEDGITTKTYNVKVTRQESSDTSLKELTVSDGSLTPTFNKDDNKDEYEVIVQNEVTDLTINATPTSSAASVVVSGNTNLSVGTNTATITVTAEDGTIKYYTVKILRQPSSNNFLSSLSVIDKNNKEYITTFVKTTTTYDITVENDIDSVTIASVVDDSTSVKQGGDGTQSLNIGLNTFEISVISAANIERVYTINVTRKANSNAYLSSLEVVGQTMTPAFNKETLVYTVDVDNTVDSITINAAPEVSTSNVAGAGTHNLNTGVNTFNIDVTSEDATVKTYVVVVNKEASDNSYLSNLSVTPGTLTPTFNKETSEYTVHVDNATTMLTITADPEDSASTVSGDGIKSLSVGTQAFEIVVTAENNTQRTYKITVTRDASSVNDLSDLTIDGTTVSGFNKDVQEYTLSVDNDVTSINVGATKVDETSEVSGIGTINLNTGENIINVTVTAENGDVKVYELKVSRAKSSNNYLSKLGITEGTISPEFNKETTSYTITVPYEVTSLTIDAKPEDSTASIDIDSNNNFIVGTNKVMVNVVAEDGTVRPHEIIVTRQPQSNNFLTDLVVEGNDGVRYSISPEFDKYTYAYNVELPATVESVNIKATKEVASLIVEGDGNVPITSLPQLQKVIVKTTGGLERTYTITFKKGLSSNTNLKNIILSEGTLSPGFNENEDIYLVKLPAGTKNLTITAEKSEEEQTVTGDGLINLNPGDNRVNITVTSEDGNTKIYKIIVDVSQDSSGDAENPYNVLDSITVNKGTLSPEFNKDTNYYSVDLDASEESISIDATGDNTITGTGTYNLNMGANVFEIKSIDPDGLENVYTVTVNKGSINSKYLALLKVEDYDLNESFSKENTNYSLTIANPVSKLDVIAIPENKDATVQITGNTNLQPGNNIINVKVTDPVDGELTYTINVNIGQNKITSDIHTINDKYVTTIKENTTSSTVKDEMTNPNEYLKIYDLDGTQISDSDKVATGYVIKLEINGTVHDSKTLIIKGDVNRNGEVDAGDLIQVKRYILGSLTLSEHQVFAADVNNNDDADPGDLIQIKRHILGNYNIFGKKVGE